MNTDRAARGQRRYMAWMRVCVRLKDDVYYALSAVAEKHLIAALATFLWFGERCRARSHCSHSLSCATEIDYAVIEQAG